ncbi:aldehyde ferredoxin oxidoreductase C-terminal domain-containing protein [Desulforhopalus singaporensis]|uniref:Aldehyde:ferredoxin oxidoreductase n=1 Tax=Desulforhopalus singaporensis TaxID=91360 RepID=A0A1H0SMF6_9BACT|nr:aldehyde ferredoxin oxidoreductase C-terminal domain-containing protein [Desulforhopalus singaporensis]SDP42428.1 aldehyde:ferredoxin oxidoreductase [Desulforhopalus singaporensis]
MVKLLRIRLDTKEYSLNKTDDKYRNLGGRGLTSRIIAQEVSPDCDPLGPANKLVFSPGILAGSTVPNSGRLSIGSKSPLTQTIKEANAGGAAAHKLARLGLQAIVLEGSGAAWSVVKIDNNGVTFDSAESLEMKGINATIDYCRELYGDKCCVIAIGQGGELCLGAAAIAVTSPDHFPRMAGRGGLGAVMGAKKVKAIVVDDTGCMAPRLKNPALFSQSVKAFTQGITAHPLAQGLNRFGTPLLIGMINEMGALTTKNYSLGKFAGAEKISGECIADLLDARTGGETSHRCMTGCVMSCSNIYTDPQGKVIVSGLEYETLALMGANCMIDDVDIIARMNGVCNDYGLDTMDVGGAIGVAMEANLLSWGDGPAALRMVEDIVCNTKNARMIGHGCRYTGEKLGVNRIPHVKGQCLAGYDPRVLKGTGTTYATSPMGADHTCGNAMPSPANPAYDPSAPKGQAPVSQFLQRYFAAIDTLGLCLFAALPPLDNPDLQKHLIDCAGAVLDESLEEQYLMRLGKMVLDEERKFNLAVGFTEKDDRLPEFFRTEHLEQKGSKFDVTDEELDSVHR